MANHHQNANAILVGMEQPANAKILKMNARLTDRYAWGKAIARVVSSGQTVIKLANATLASKENTVNILLD